MHEPGLSPHPATGDIGSLLLEAGLLDAPALARVRRVAGETRSRLDQAVTQLGLLTERALAEALARRLGLGLAQPADYPAAPVLADRLKVKFLRKARALPLAADMGELRLAMADPLDGFVRRSVEIATGRRVVPLVAVPVDLEAALDRLYRAAAEDEAGRPAAEASGRPEEDAERLKDLASGAPVIRLVNQLIGQAVEIGASDIHLEPFEDRLRVRYRVDGLLREAESPPLRLAAAVISRIKIMARLDIAERRLPQDGRIRLAVRGSEIDFRISTVPSLHGETVVLRVLDRRAVNFSFDRLGLAGDVVERFRQLLEKPNGIILVTGPTGSGKTTTLYTGLLHLNAVERKIFTVEDPIEYHLPGVNQIQVKPAIGLTFAGLLRAILRQDPDVIMVGEIRDLETAQIAVQAALTGHLVLSTLHTNGAAASVIRLRDMGLEDYLQAATLNGVLAQRLVRRLCDCRVAVTATPELVRRFDLTRLAGEAAPRLWEPGSCALCHGTGYRGRTAIAELMVPDAAVQRLILAGADQGAIEAAATASGMANLLERGVAEALAGRTTLAEVVRSVGDAE